MGRLFLRGETWARRRGLCGRTEQPGPGALGASPRGPRARRRAPFSPSLVHADVRSVPPGAVSVSVGTTPNAAVRARPRRPGRGWRGLPCGGVAVAGGACGQTCHEKATEHRGFHGDAPAGMGKGGFVTFTHQRPEATDACISPSDDAALGEVRDPFHVALAPSPGLPPASQGGRVPGEAAGQRWAAAPCSPRLHVALGTSDSGDGAAHGAVRAPGTGSAGCVLTCEPLATWLGPAAPSGAHVAAPTAHTQGGQQRGSRRVTADVPRHPACRQTRGPQHRG